MTSKISHLAAATVIAFLPFNEATAIGGAIGGFGVGGSDVLEDQARRALQERIDAHSGRNDYLAVSQDIVRSEYVESVQGCKGLALEWQVAVSCIAPQAVETNIYHCDEQYLYVDKSNESDAIKELIDENGTINVLWNSSDQELNVTPHFHEITKYHERSSLSVNGWEISSVSELNAVNATFCNFLTETSQP